MALRLFKATANQKIPLGEFLSDTDGKTPMTGLTIANTDIKIWKAFSSALVNKNAGGATHMAGGVYHATLDETDTSVFGPLVIFVHVAGALPIKVECNVEDPADFYKRYNWFRTMVVASATGTPTTTTIPITLVYPDAAASSISGTYVGMLVTSLTGGGAPAGGAVTRVAAYNGTTKTLTVEPPFPAAISAGELLVLAPGAPGMLADNALTAAKVAPDAVTEIQSGLATAAALTTVSGYVDELESRLTAGRALALDALTTGVPLSAATIDAILDDVVEGSTTLRQAVRLMLASLVGKASGGGTATVSFRDLADTKNRVVMTTDASGNRTAVTRDAT